MDDEPKREELSTTERWLAGELFKLRQQVSSYAVRMLGADIEQAGPPNAEEEFQMGSRLVELGTVMVARATERAGTVPNKDGDAVESGSADNRE